MNIRRGARTCIMTALAAGTFACATSGAGDTTAVAGAGSAVGGDAPSRASGDTSALVPAGYGALRQEDVALRVTLQGVQVRAIPLDESILRVLSPDSYRALRDLGASRRDEIERIAARYGVREPSVWYLSFFGMQPDARFSPMEVIVTSGGRDHRPLDVIPLSPGFGENRLRQRETQTAIYVFDEDVDPEQPLTITIQGERNDTWSDILQRIQRERALIRSRARRP